MPTQKFTARAWFERRTRTAQPSYEAILTMLGEIERQLRDLGMAPVALSVITFPPGTFIGAHADKHLAVMSIDAEPGELTRSLKCWYAWQHARWRFARVGEAVLALPPRAAGEGGPGAPGATQPADAGGALGGQQQPGPLELLISWPLAKDAAAERSVS